MYRKTDEMKRCFSEYLTLPEWEWTWFVTQTFDLYKCGYIRRTPEFKLALHSDIVNESWKFFINLVGDTATACWGFVFEEKHVNGRPHWHALVHVGKDLFDQPNSTDVWRRMFDKYGFMEIRHYRPELAERAGSYLSKYLAKGTGCGESTFEFDGFLSGKQADSRQIMRACGVDGSGII